MAIPLEARDVDLAFLTFPKPQPQRTISLAWRPSSPRAAEFKLLGEQLTQRVVGST